MSHRNILLFGIFFYSVINVFSQDSGPLVFKFGTNASDYGVKCETVLPEDHRDVSYGMTGAVLKNTTFCTTQESFAFWVTLPEGNYRIKVVVGNKSGISTNTIKAESRRLMVYNYTTESGKIDTVEFIVNIRRPAISTGGSISLKTREYPYLNWDRFLTLEFAGTGPCIRELSIEEADVPTIFLAGNSTVVDQEVEPWASWGQMFPLYLKPEVSVANFAESGESLMSFEAEYRLKKVQSQIGTGDYLFSEFAHNDQKTGIYYVEPYTTYQEYLLKFANIARNAGATPVFVTSTNRRSFDTDGNIVNTLGDYPAAMRDLSGEESIFLVDLNDMSKSLFEALGTEGSKQAFVHFPADYFPWGNDALADNTHFNTYGAWQLAKCVVEGIRSSDSPLKAFLKDDVEAYDPGIPDATDSWLWPLNIHESVKLADTLTTTFIQVEKEVSGSAVPGEMNSADPVFYPNPVSGQITFNAKGRGFVEIFAIDGKKILEKETDLQATLDVSFLPPGVYILHLRTEKGTIKGGMIKK